ncbi:MAG: cyclic nucleotide-binding domain-containing protein [Gammaproteobacteria bacterium]
MRQEKPEEKYHDQICRLTSVEHLSSELQEKLISRAEITMVPAGNELFKQEQERLFYLLEGDVDIYKDTVFSEAILAGTEEAKDPLNKDISMSAMAKTRVVILSVNKSYVEALNNYVGETKSETERNSAEESLNWLKPLFSLDIFSQISSSLTEELAARFDTMKVKKGDQIITQNMPGNYFYFIGEGSCEVTQHDFTSGRTETLSEMGAGEFFGDEALLVDQKRTATVTMLTTGYLLKLARKDYDELIQSSVLILEQETKEREAKNSLAGTPIESQMASIDQRMSQLKSMLRTETNHVEDWLNDEKNNEAKLRESEGFEPIEDLGVLIEARKKIDQIECIPASDSLEDDILKNEEANKAAIDSHNKVSELGLLRAQLENAQSHIQEQQRIVEEDQNGEQKELTLKNVSKELDLIKTRLEKQETYELTRRNSFEQQLATEREKMREQMDRFSTGLEKQQSRSLQIERVKQQATIETRQIIEKFKEAHEQYRLRNEKNIQNVRAKLQSQVAQVLEKARHAKAEKDQALEALQEANQQLAELKKQQLIPQVGNTNDDSTVDNEVPLLMDIESIGNASSKHVDKTLSEARTRQSDQTENKDTTDEDESLLAKVSEKPKESEANGFFEQLKKHNADPDTPPELADWITSDDHSTIDHQNLTEEQKASLERVKKITNKVLEDAFSGHQNRPGNS